MKFLLKTVPLPAPLRDVQIAQVTTAEAEFQAQCQQAVQASFERGRIEGEKALSQQLLKQRAELLEIQNGLLSSLQQIIPRAVEQCEAGLVELAVEVAQKLVAGLPVSRDLIERAIREAIARIEESAVLSIQLHPEDLALLQSTGSPLLEPQAADRRLHFEVSPEVSRGGCRLLTRFGVIDACRETKVQLIKKSLAS